MKSVLTILLLLSQFSLGSQYNYVFGWTQLNDPDLMIPRGGTSSCLLYTSPSPRD